MISFFLTNFMHLLLSLSLLLPPLFLSSDGCVLRKIHWTEGRVSGIFLQFWSCISYHWISTECSSFLQESTWMFYSCSRIWFGEFFPPFTQLYQLNFYARETNLLTKFFLNETLHPFHYSNRTFHFFPHEQKQFDLRPEIAYNLSQIYRSSGSTQLALFYLHNYCTV